MVDGTERVWADTHSRSDTIEATKTPRKALIVLTGMCSAGEREMKAGRTRWETGPSFATTSEGASCRALWMRGTTAQGAIVRAMQTGSGRASAEAPVGQGHLIVMRTG